MPGRIDIGDSRLARFAGKSPKLRGGDPNIGSRLPLLLKHGGFVDVGVNIVQPMAFEGETKLITQLTMETMSDAAIAEGLTTKEEVDDLVKALYDYAQDPATLGGVPRIMQSWGKRV